MTAALDRLSDALVVAIVGNLAALALFVGLGVSLVVRRRRAARELARRNSLHARAAGDAACTPDPVLPPHRVYNSHERRRGRRRSR